MAKIVYFGGYASRQDIPDATKRSLIEFIRTNWKLGAQMLAGLFDPHASGDEIAEYTRMQRAAASAEAASIFLQLDLDADVRGVLPDVTVPRSCCIAAAIAPCRSRRGRELAALLPNARFVPLTGDSHLPYRDDQRELMRALAGFLHGEAAAEPTAPRRSRSRETEVLRLVSTGHEQPRDRRDARAERAHGAPSRREHPAQARAVLAGRRGDPGCSRRHHLNASTGVRSPPRW